MGALRVISIILITIILIPLLLLSNLFLTFNLSYGPENIAENTKPLIEENLPESNMSINQAFEMQCSQTQRESIDIRLGQVPCSKIENSENEFQTAITHIYNQEQNCEFMDCYSNIEGPSIMISEKTENNLSKVSWIFIGITLLFLLLAFLSFKRNSSFLLYMGIVLILFSPTAFLLKETATSSALGSLSGPASGGMMQNALGILFNSSGLVTIIWAVLGIIPIGWSIVIKSTKNHT